jgi:Glycosyl transferase family 2
VTTPEPVGPDAAGTASPRRPPRVSVVLPVHKSEAYLAAAVESIVAQSFGDWELLAIDDGLSDESSAILRSFAARDPRVTVVLAAGAPFVAKLARGVALARGELIARMDADDIAHCDRFVLQVAFLDEHPEVAVVGSAVTLIDAHGKTIREAHYPEDPAAVAEALQTGSALAHPAVMMRRGAVLAVGGYRPAYQYAEDYDLWLRMAERYALANLPDRLLYYRQHAAKLSVVYAAEQRLATRIAQFAARCRRAGKPDPTEGLTALSPRDIDRFDLSPQEGSTVSLDIADALLAADPSMDSPSAIEKAVDILGQVDFAAVPGARLVRTMMAIGHGFARRRRPILAAKWFLRAATCHSDGLGDVCAIVVNRAKRRAAWLGERFHRT